MKHFLTLLICLFLYAGTQAQGTNWTSYYASPDSTLIDGNNIWSVSGNTLIQFDKTTGYYVRTIIPDSIFACNQHVWYIGLPQGPNNPFLETHGGYPFVNGVSFDGQDWGTVSMQSVLPSIANFTYHRSVTDNAGNTFFFTNGGEVVRYDGNSYYTWDTVRTLMNNYGLSAYVPTFFNNSFCAFDGNNSLWVDAPGMGIFKFSSNTCAFYDSIAIDFSWYGGPLFSPNGIFCDPYSSNVYVGIYGAGLGDTTAKYFMFDGNQWHFDSVVGIRATYQINAILFEPGASYFVTPYGIYLKNGSIYNPVTLPNQPSTLDIRFCVPDNNGNYWIKWYDNSLSLYDGTSFTSYPDDHAVLANSNTGFLNNNMVMAQAFDKSGNQYVVCSSGLLKRTGNTFSTVHISNFVSTYSGIAFDTSGNLWHCTPSGSIAYYDGTDHPVHIDSNTSVNGFAASHSDTIWMATSRGVAVISQYHSFSVLPLSGIAGNAVYSIAVDTNNNKWLGFGTVLGLGRVIGDSLTLFNSNNSGAPDTVTCLAVDPQNRVWIGSTSGLYLHYDSNWIAYNTSNSGMPGDSVESIFFKNGNVYVSTQNNGFGIFDGTNWRIFSPKSYPLDADIESIAVDDSCNVWLGEECGLIKMQDATCLQAQGYRLLHGHSQKADGSASVHELIYLMQYDSVANVMRPVDNTYTDAQGAYSFNTTLNQVYVHAVPYNGAETGGIMPAYEDSSIVQQNAHPIQMTSAAVIQDLRSINATYQGGYNKLHGKVNDQHGKAVAGLRLFLMQSGVPVATIVTGLDGKFTFSGLNVGTYKIWVDKMGIDNGLAPNVTFPSATNAFAQCILSATQLSIVSFVTGMGEAESAASLNIYPNPARSSLNVYLPGVEPAEMIIYDMTGKEMLKRTIVPGQQRLDVDYLDGGIYQIRVQSAMMSETRKLVVKKVDAIAIVFTASLVFHYHLLWRG